MFLHKRRLMLAVMLFVLFIGITGLSVYAQDVPAHTGPPVTTRVVTNVPEVWATPECDKLYGYAHKAQITLVSQNNVAQRWYDDNGVFVYGVYSENERVNITALYPDGTFGKSVDLMLNFSAQLDGITRISSMSGLRSAIIRPDGSTEAVNVGDLTMIADPGFSSIRGDVLSQSGRWDAVEGTRFDHIKYVCGLVSD